MTWLVSPWMWVALFAAFFLLIAGLLVWAFWPVSVDDPGDYCADDPTLPWEGE